MLSNLLQDIRYSLHGFALRPMFAVVAVLTLAVAIGVNVAVFSMFERLALEELPVANPRELVNLVAPGPKAGFQLCNNQGTCDETFSYPMFRDLEQAGAPFIDVAASRSTPATLSRADSTTMGSVMLVSGSYFGALGIGPHLGRLLSEADLEGAPASAVLSFDYWASAFAADPAILGTTLVVGGQPLTIVGVAPRGFFGTTIDERPSVFAPLTFEWFPIKMPAPIVEDRFVHYAYLFGRLQPGVSLEQAQAALNVRYRAIVAEVEAPLVPARESADFDLEAFRAKTLTLVPGARGQSQLPRVARGPLGIFFAATATVLLIACVNLANLLFARGAARVGEIAVRASLGAARFRLVSLLSAEALLLAAFAALLSLPVALGVLRVVGIIRPPGLGFGGELTLDLRAVAAAFAIAAVAAVVFALLPIAKLAGTDPVRALQGNAARAFGGKNLGRFRFGLATSQIALSMTLLVLAALFTQSLANVARVDLGMRTESIATFTIAPNLAGYAPERQAQAIDAVERELKAEPGVTHVSSAMVGLVTGSGWGTDVAVEGHERAAGDDGGVNVNRVSPTFFETLDIPLLQGRGFTAADTVDSPLVAVVNESFAKRFGLGATPVGKRLGLNASGPLDVEIVGLVRDTAYSSVKGPFPAQLILPRLQTRQFGNAFTFYVRGGQSPEALLAAVPRIVRRVDSNLPVMDARTFEAEVRNNVSTDRLLMTLAVTLAGVATLLAALGLYGVLSYMVAQRTREIGLRLALGAEPGTMRRMVMRQVGWMAGIGVPIGIVAALAIGNLAASFLFGLAPTDPRAIIAAAALLAAVVFGASYWPARRASRVEPVVALRAE